MRASVMFGTAAMALVVAAPVHAQQTRDQTQAAQESECMQRLDQVRQDLRENENFAAVYRDTRMNFRELIQAARTFDGAGLTQRCMEVVTGVRELAEHEVQQRAERRGETGDQQDRARRQQPDPADQQARDQQARQRIQGAQPLGEATISAESLNGANVINQNNEDLGSVDDVIVANGQIQAIIVERGGFLGIGESNYRVEAQQVRVLVGGRDMATRDRDTEARNREAQPETRRGAERETMGDTRRAMGGIERVTVMLQMTEQELESLPQVDKQGTRWVPEDEGARQRDTGTQQNRQPREDRQ